MAIPQAPDGAEHGGTPQPEDRESLTAFAALEAQAYELRDVGRPFLDVARAALDLAERGDDALRCRAVRLHAEALHQAGDTLGAITSAERAVVLARSLGARGTTLAARALLSEAIAHDAIGSFERATRALIEAVGLSDGSDDTALLASLYNSLGVVRSRAGDPEAGLSHYRRAAALRERLGDRSGQLQLLNNIGINLKNLGRLEESLASNHAALALADEMGDTLACATVLANRGILYAALGDTDAAFAAYDRAEGLTQALGTEVLTAELTRRRAELALQCDDLELAASELERALQRSRASHDRRGEQLCLALRAEVAERRGELRQAINDLRSAHALEAELREAADAERLRRLTLAHDLELLRHEHDSERERNRALEEAYRELERLHRRVADQATLLEARSRTDALTEVANRAHLDERLQAEARRLQRYGGSLAVAMLDIDHFKRVNDAFGHAVGDDVLRIVAQLMREHTRDSDLVARYGGEEFALVMPETDTAQATAVCRKLLTAVRRYPWHDVHRDLRTVTVSAGVADSSDAADPSALLARADERLIRAKRGGRARVVTNDSARS